ncbi:hypothetical protein ES705_32984 [subsurface metagenome]
MPIHNPVDAGPQIAVHAALDTAVHGVGVSTVCSETEVDAIAIAAIETYFGITEATLADFQAIPATGTMLVPELINDNNTGTTAMADAVDKYAEVDFGLPKVINQWRHYGYVNNNSDGEWKLQYMALLGGWVDWVTGIPTRAASWTELSVETEVITRYIRLVCTVTDSQVNDNQIQEFEVYHN